MTDNDKHTVKMSEIYVMRNLFSTIRYFHVLCMDRMNLLRFTVTYCLWSQTNQKNIRYSPPSTESQ